jgi:hypothetical protein
MIGVVVLFTDCVNEGQTSMFREFTTLRELLNPA